jgi:hypothetical protein
MEQNMRFGLILGRLAILKKSGRADYEQLLGAVFFMFSGAKKNLNFFLKNPSVRTKKLHKMLFIKKIFDFFLNFF